jgi:hypothetical protein
LKLNCHYSLSNVASNSNLRRYSTVESSVHAAAAAAAKANRFRVFAHAVVAANRFEKAKNAAHTVSISIPPSQ